MGTKLTIRDHSRDVAGLTYVYPVLSRRAGGISVGINFNVNNACNWRCVYCQVPDLALGSAPEVDLLKLRDELCFFLDYVDPDRIGIWGSSYGGTLSVYSLLKRPGLFQVGVAAAAAVDPVFFGTDDVAIVRRPQTHPEVFERKALKYAANLKDNLLFIHGMQDHVVPFKTIAVLAEELIKQGKDFDFAFAPGATHGWSRERYYDRYLFGKLIEYFDRHLGEPAE